MLNAVEVQPLASDMYGRAVESSGNVAATTGQLMNGVPAAPTGTVVTGADGQPQPSRGREQSGQGQGGQVSQGSQAPGATNSAIQEAVIDGQHNALATGKLAKRARCGAAPAVQLTDAELDLLPNPKTQTRGKRARG